MIQLHFPIQASAKERPRFTRSGRCYTPLKTRTFEHTLKTLAAQQYKEALLQGPLHVILKIEIPKPASAKARVYPLVKPDLDNLQKAIFDALNGVVWKDDAQVISCNAEKMYTLGSPLIRVRVVPL